MYKSEDQLLADCFTWFWNTFPNYRGLLFHPANELPVGGRYGTIQRLQMKAKGVVPGVPDLVWMGGRCAGLEAKLPGQKPCNEQKRIADIWFSEGRDFFFFDTKGQFMGIMDVLIHYKSALKEPSIYNYLQSK